MDEKEPARHKGNTSKRKAETQQCSKAKVKTNEKAQGWLKSDI